MQLCVTRMFHKPDCVSKKTKNVPQEVIWQRETSDPDTLPTTRSYHVPVIQSPGNSRLVKLFFPGL